ncbi:MAG: imidazoleglycerol-phosphate dehydratase HisB [Ruminococcaceae bacterium]|nr:imidazoleglycerol-phosphate dehydratase HisB [Oscillospiraceae bacterium]
MRKANIQRKTAETDISLALNLDGCGITDIETGCGFLDHMLTLFASHGKFDLAVKCVGDTKVDDHHTVEDIGICLGQAFSEALADKRGIVRYGNFILPMDEALIMTAVDISGRSYLGYGLTIPSQKIGSFDTELVEEFFLAFTRQCPMSLHIQQLAGKNSHHIVEGCFKSVARSLKAAAAIDAAYADQIPSTKGVL